MTIGFYSTQGQYGCFSNFSRHSFWLDEKQWQTSEHYFQAQKFLNTEYYDLVHKAKTPREAATHGRNRSFPLRQDWQEVKEDAMRKALHAKFTQNKEIKDVLLSTHDQDLVEETTDDYYWGCGTDRTGKNRLGVLLVELRNKLIQSESK
jgi:N-glycosidase YbiA